MSASVPDNFLGLPAPHNAYVSARFAVLPIPYDATTSFGVGTREGPRAVITASQQVELYDEHLRRESWRGGVATLESVEPDARGPEPTLKRIHAAARRVVRDGKFLIGLGGEHSVTSALVRAVRTRHKRLSVLQIDAHADLRDSYQGSPFSHASVMRRIHEMRVPAVAVGVRNYSTEEARFIRANEMRIISARKCRESDDWIARAVDGLRDEVYVTIDIDGFDPAYAPGTGTPEPGGLDWYQVTDLLEAVAKARRIVAADCVEVRPLPPNTVTEFLAAKLVYRLMGLVERFSK
jgi:agmatinase